MNSFLFFMLCAQAAGVIAWSLSRAERLNYFSTLLAIAFAGFALPQLYGLLAMSGDLPPGGMSKTLLMANLCFACAMIGFHSRTRPLAVLQWTYTPRSLLFISAFLTIIGSVFYFKITRLPPEMLNMGQWSGTVTAYNFFATALPYGLVIALFLVFRKPSLSALFLAALSSALVLDRAIVGKRSSAAVLLLTIILSLWLFKRKPVPRSVFLALAVAGFFIVNSIGDYRQTITGQPGGFSSVLLGGPLPELKDIGKISFVENVRKLASEGGSEYLAAVYGIADADERMAFDFGTSHWDGFVHHNVPAQFLGRDFKESLKLNMNRPAAANPGYEKAACTSEPGIVDAFRSFWYFGCLEFLAIGLFMRMILTTALAGNLNFKFLYIILLPNAMLIVSHPIDFFLQSIIHSAFFVGGAILLVRIFQPPAVPSRSLVPGRPKRARGRQAVCRGKA